MLPGKNKAIWDDYIKKLTKIGDIRNPAVMYVEAQTLLQDLSVLASTKKDPIYKNLENNLRNVLQSIADQGAELSAIERGKLLKQPLSTLIKKVENERSRYVTADVAAEALKVITPQAAELLKKVTPPHSTEQILAAISKTSEQAADIIIAMPNNWQEARPKVLSLLTSIGEQGARIKRVLIDAEKKLDQSDAKIAPAVKKAIHEVNKRIGVVDRTATRLKRLVREKLLQDSALNRTKKLLVKLQRRVNHLDQVANAVHYLAEFLPIIPVMGDYAKAVLDFGVMVTKATKWSTDEALKFTNQIRVFLGTPEVDTAELANIVKDLKSARDGILSEYQGLLGQLEKGAGLEGAQELERSAEQIMVTADAILKQIESDPAAIRSNWQDVQPKIQELLAAVDKHNDRMREALDNTEKQLGQGDQRRAVFKKIAREINKRIGGVNKVAVELKQLVRTKVLTDSTLNQIRNSLMKLNKRLGRLDQMATVTHYLAEFLPTIPVMGNYAKAVLNFGVVATKTTKWGATRALGLTNLIMAILGTPDLKTAELKDMINDLIKTKQEMLRKYQKLSGRMEVSEELKHSTQQITAEIDKVLAQITGDPVTVMNNWSKTQPEIQVLLTTVNEHNASIKKAMNSAEEKLYPNDTRVVPTFKKIAHEISKIVRDTDATTDQLKQVIRINTPVGPALDRAQKLLGGMKKHLGRLDKLSNVARYLGDFLPLIPVVGVYAKAVVDLGVTTTKTAKWAVDRGAKIADTAEKILY